MGGLYFFLKRIMSPNIIDTNKHAIDHNKDLYSRTTNPWSQGCKKLIIWSCSFSEKISAYNLKKNYRVFISCENIMQENCLVPYSDEPKFITNQAMVSNNMIKIFYWKPPKDI